MWPIVVVINIDKRVTGTNMWSDRDTCVFMQLCK